MNSDDPTPTAPLMDRGHWETSPVIVLRGGTLGADGQGVVVTFEVPDKGRVTLTVWADRRVQWRFSPAGPGGPLLQAGGGVTWRWGRLTRTGAEAYALLAILAHLGLSTRAVQQELRQMTAYVDGTE